MLETTVHLLSDLLSIPLLPGTTGLKTHHIMHGTCFFRLEDVSPAGRPKVSTSN